MQSDAPIALALMLMATASWNLVLVCSATAVVVEPATNESDNQGQTKLQALFDWRRYYQHFAKEYNSPLEAMTRRAYLLANAIRVYVTGLAYKKRKASHYLALNHLSDRSPKELERMLNVVMADGESTIWSSVAPGDAHLQDNDFADLAKTLETQIGQELERRNIEEAPDNFRKEADGKVEIQRTRKKRNIEAKADREITLDMLIQDTGPVGEPAEVLEKMETKPKSNNPNYDPTPTATPVRRSLVEQQEKLSAWRFSVQPSESINRAARPRSILDQVREFMGGLGQNLLGQKASEQLPDEMFHDLRQTGCMHQPRDQGDECGSCYAFAGVAMAEFLFCKAMGKLYAFSEQYVVDCGKDRVGHMRGCLGALDKDLPAFVHNYGLELRDRYPYAGGESQCPYSNETDLKTTGYIRMDLKDYLFVPVQVWPQVLKVSPVFVGLAAPDHFLQYGGGVDSGRRCAQKSNHAVLVVGHGREDGQEFWLMRNSHGVHWGQGGYYKLAKSAPERCIDKQMGLVWGTKNALDFGIRTALNELNLAVKHNPVPDLNKLFT